MSTLMRVGILASGILATLLLAIPASAAPFPREVILLDAQAINAGYGTFLIDQAEPLAPGAYDITDLEVRLDSQAAGAQAGMVFLAATGRLTVKDSGAYRVGSLLHSGGGASLRLRGNGTYELVVEDDLLLGGDYEVSANAINQPLPEPGMLALFAAGLGALGLAARRSRRVPKA